MNKERKAKALNKWNSQKYPDKFILSINDLGEGLRHVKIKDKDHYDHVGTPCLRAVERDIDNYPWDRSNKENDFKADTWSFGAFLFWCLTGDSPFYHEDFA